MTISSSSSTATADHTYDYIIVGGGVAGVVLASRLSHLLQSSPSDTTKRILLLEGGIDPTTKDSESILHCTGAHAARVSSHTYQLPIAANKNLNGRSIVVPVGKALGGSGVVNGGAWTRGSRSDYDLWARTVGDDAWGYDSLLPFMKRVESVAVSEDNGVLRNDDQHGYAGPVKATPVLAMHPERKYPLRESVQKMWEEVGVKHLVDGNSGDQNGLTELVELWFNGERQLPGKIFNLSNVDVKTGQVVQRITFGQDEAIPVANGVELAGGEHFVARREVIVSAGAYHSPQILKLSGIGASTELKKHGIQTVLENPEVGKNLMDHLCLGLAFKLKDPERGMAIGSPHFTNPAYFAGWPLDFIMFGPLDHPQKLKAFIKNREEKDLLLRPDASHMEIVTMYVGMGKLYTGQDTRMDGTIISSMAGALTTTSRGTVTLQTARIENAPIIDVNFFDTDADRYIMREAVRKAASVHLNTKTGKSFVSHEMPPEGYVAVVDATDDDLDRRIVDLGRSFDHPMGTCSMGKVVDSHCRVVGVKGLRVVDASIFPIPICCHPQAAVYATAERVAEWIGKGD